MALLEAAVRRVSVIVPFLNAHPFLEEAVASVLGQTYADWELLLVDDGSTDPGTQIARELAAAHPARIRYLEHPGHRNLGVCASRNLAVREARGDLVALLDADDVWLPTKLAEQVEILDRHPRAGMVYGHSRYWRSWRPELDETHDRVPPLGVATDRLYRPGELSLLLYPMGRAAAPCPSDLLLRKSLVERVGGFEEDFHHEYQLYEDQAFLSKVYLASHVFVSSACWDLYRLHADSCDARVHRSGQYDKVRRFFLAWFDEYLQRKHPRSRRVRRRVARALAAGAGRGRDDRRALAAGARASRAGEPKERVRWGNLRRTAPFSRRYGYDRGQPIDRHLIEEFLGWNALAIRGRVLEVGDDEYTRRFGAERVAACDVLHVRKEGPRVAVVGDLGAGVPHVASATYDCIVLTQTLHLIYDLRTAVSELHRLLRPGGTLLATFPGLSQISRDEWGKSWYWGLTTASARRLFEERFGGANVTVESRGNVLTAVSFLQGIAAGELRPDELEENDPDYQLLITVRAVRGGGELPDVEIVTARGPAPTAGEAGDAPGAPAELLLLLRPEDELDVEALKVNLARMADRPHAAFGLHPRAAVPERLARTDRGPVDELGAVLLDGAWTRPSLAIYRRDAVEAGGGLGALRDGPAEAALRARLAARHPVDVFPRPLGPPPPPLPPSRERDHLAGVLDRLGRLDAAALPGRARRALATARRVVRSELADRLLNAIAVARAERRWRELLAHGLALSKVAPGLLPRSILGFRRSAPVVLEVAGRPGAAPPVPRGGRGRRLAVDRLHPPELDLDPGAGTRPGAFVRLVVECEGASRRTEVVGDETTLPTTFHNPRLLSARLPASVALAREEIGVRLRTPRWPAARAHRPAPRAEPVAAGEACPLDDGFWRYVVELPRQRIVRLRVDPSDGPEPYVVLRALSVVEDGSAEHVPVDRPDALELVRMRFAKASGAEGHFRATGAGSPWFSPLALRDLDLTGSRSASLRLEMKVSIGDRLRVLWDLGDGYTFTRMRELPLFSAPFSSPAEEAESR